MDPPQKHLFIWHAWKDKTTGVENVSLGAWGWSEGGGEEFLEWDMSYVLTLCQNTLKGTLQRENFIVYKLYFNKLNLKNINFVTNQTQDGGILLSNKKGTDYLLQPQ